MMFSMCTLHNAQKSCRRPSKQQWKVISQFFRPYVPVLHSSKCQHARLHRPVKPQPVLPSSPLQRRASTSPWQAHPQCCPRPPRSSCEQPLRTALLPQSPSPSACHCPGPAKRSEGILRMHVQLQRKPTQSSVCHHSLRRKHCSHCQSVSHTSAHSLSIEGGGKHRLQVLNILRDAHRPLHGNKEAHLERELGLSA